MINLNKWKKIVYYLCEFLLAISLFIIILLFILKITILSPNYIINKMQENNYYEQVYKSLEKEMPNYIIQSGLPKEVLEDIYTKEEIKKELDKYIKALYQGKAEKINTKNIEEKLSKNIDNYFNENNIRITEKESIDKFILQIADIYKTEIIQSDSILKMQDFIPKIVLFINIVIGITIFIIITLLFMIKLVLKNKIKSISFLTVAFLLLISYFFIKESIDIKNLIILTDYFSTLVKGILNQILNNIRNSAIILIIISIIKIIIDTLIKKKKEIKRITIEE